MIIEQDYKYEAEIEVADLNEDNFLKPLGYLRLVNKVIEKHLNGLEFNVEMTMRHGLAWALVSLSVDVLKPVAGVGGLQAVTWHSERKGPFFRREFQFSNRQGDPVFQGSSFSVLLDMKKRTVFRETKLPFDLMAAGGETTISARPTFRTELEFTEVEERKVYNSHIDCLGHVNNIRYAEYAYDAFSPEEISNMASLRRMEFYFTKELRPGDRFRVLKKSDNNCLMVRCVNKDSAETNFNSVFYS